MNIQKLSSVLAGLTLLASLSFGQTALNLTTLSAAVDNKQTSFAVASATGITAPVLNTAQGGIGGNSGTGTILLFVDRELMKVTAISSTTVTVIRGQGSAKTAHVSGAKVIAGPAAAFAQFDPSGACTRTLLTYTPVVNTVTGTINDCTAGNWSNFTTNPGTGTVIASTAGTIAPLAKVTHVSGTAAITGFTVPAGLLPGNSLTLIPDGAWTYTTAGNLGLAGTAVANKALHFTWDGTKFYAIY